MAIAHPASNEKRDACWGVRMSELEVDKGTTVTG